MKQAVANKITKHLVQVDKYLGKVNSILKNIDIEVPTRGPRRKTKKNKKSYLQVKN